MSLANLLIIIASILPKHVTNLQLRSRCPLESVLAGTNISEHSLGNNKGNEVEYEII
jgi:hypothetical protein